MLEDGVGGELAACLGRWFAEVESQALLCADCGVQEVAVMVPAAAAGS